MSRPWSGGPMGNGLPKGVQCGRVETKLGRKTKYGSREGNVGNDALHVIGLHGPGDKISLFLEGLGAGEGGIELPHGPGHAVPGNARGLVAGLPLPRGLSSQQEKPFSHRGGAVTKGEGCGERK